MVQDIGNPDILIAQADAKQVLKDSLERHLIKLPKVINCSVCIYV